MPRHKRRLGSVGRMRGSERNDDNVYLFRVTRFAFLWPTPGPPFSAMNSAPASQNFFD
jgi:hypothetical protein